MRPIIIIWQSKYQMHSNKAVWTIKAKQNHSIHFCWNTWCGCITNCVKHICIQRSNACLKIITILIVEWWSLLRHAYQPHESAKNASSCSVLERVLGLAQFQCSSFFPFIFLRTTGHCFILFFWSLTSRDKKNDLTRISQKIYSLGSSLVTPAFCTSLCCEIDPSLLTSMLPQSLLFCLFSNLLPFCQCFDISCSKSLDYLILPQDIFSILLCFEEYVNRKRQKIGMVRNFGSSKETCQKFPSQFIFSLIYSECY